MYIKTFISKTITGHTCLYAFATALLFSSTPLLNHAQNVGIDIANPQEKLHIYHATDTVYELIESNAVKDAGLKFKNTAGQWTLKNTANHNFTIQNGTGSHTFTPGGALLLTGSTSTGITPASGAGVRMMWIPQKKAFRAGEAVGSEWNSDSIGVYSTAFGLNNLALGTYSFVTGNYSIVRSDNSYAMGSNAFIGSGCPGSYAFGNGAAIQNPGSTAAVAIGTASIVKGGRSHAVGLVNTANSAYGYCYGIISQTATSGSFSVSVGNSSTAGGGSSIAVGNNVETASYGSVVLGAGVAGGAPLSNTVANSLMLGTGSDLPTILLTSAGGGGNTGNVGVGTGISLPTAKFQVGLNGDGSVAIANAWNTFSDARWKKDIVSIGSALDKIEKINGYYYFWKKDSTTNRQVGFIAQEIREVFPEMVNEDVNGYLSVDYSKMVAPLVQGLKEIHAENKALKAVIENMNDRVAALEKAITGKSQAPVAIETQTLPTVTYTHPAQDATTVAAGTNLSQPQETAAINDISYLEGIKVSISLHKSLSQDEKQDIINRIDNLIIELTAE